METEKFKQLLQDITIVTNDNEGQEVVDIASINLCDPDNIHNFSMPYPHRPNTIESINEIVSKENILRAMDDTRGISSMIQNINLNEKSLKILKEILPDNDFNNIQFNKTLKEYPIENYIVIEFGDDYTLGDKVEYELYIKPGDIINDKTIIGKVNQGGKELPIRSIFSHAEVMATENGDFFRLYPSATDRHIVLTNVTYGGGVDFDPDDILKYTERFTINMYLYDLIFNNLVYSTLPEILSHRESESEHYISLPLIGRIPHSDLFLCRHKNGQKVFEDYIAEYEYGDDDYKKHNCLKKFLSIFQELCDPEVIKATQGLSEKMNILAKNIQNQREITLDWIITYYRLAAVQDVCQYDGNFNDCRNLAAGLNANLAIDRKSFSNTKIGNTTYSNYYLYILSRLHLHDKNDEWGWKYYYILSEIIHNRMAIEKYSISYLISEFNQLFWYNLNLFVDNPYALVESQFNLKEGYTIDDVNQWFTEYIAKRMSTNIDVFIKNKEYTINSAAQQLANIFWFIKHFDGEDNKSMALNSYAWDPMALIEKERQILAKFWNEAIYAYKHSESVEIIIEDLTNYAQSLNQYAEWPAPFNLPVEGITYQLYEFQNPFITPSGEESPDIFTDDDLNPSDKIPTDFPIPTNVPDHYAAMKSPNDPDLNEITVKDYAYWVKYFSLATIISIIFLADGLDIPTPGGLVPIPLPAIYICLGVIYIKIFDLVLVIGLCIRGIYFSPVLLGVNLSSKYLSILVPLVAILKQVREMFYSLIEQIECTVPNLLQILINKLEAENVEYRKKNKEYEVYQEQLKAQRLENKGNLKLSMRQYLDSTADLRQIYTRVDDLKKAGSSTYNNSISKLKTSFKKKK